MKEVVVVSGKGGTGKTSVVAALATLAQRILLVDCDVDAANLHLVVDPKVRHQEDFVGGMQASICPEMCTGCGRCEEVCRYGAVRTEENEEGEVSASIDPVACEGCGVCAWFCPFGAVAFEPAVSGQWFVSDTRFGPMVHAHLAPAAENTGKLVTAIRQQARGLGQQELMDTVLIDGPPGIGCPVIATISGVGLAVVVSEPTVAGLHDFGRIAELCAHFDVPVVLCINKWDLNPDLTEQLTVEAADLGIEVLGRVRYDPAVTRAQRAGLTVVEWQDADCAVDLKDLWRNLQPLVTTTDRTLSVL